LPPGGSNIVGTLGYVDAMRELLTQIESHELPEPDVIVTAVGSGGTAAGILAGAAALGLGSRVLGVAVASGRHLAEALGLGLSWAALRRIRKQSSLSELRARLIVDDTELGRGYGHRTPDGQVAVEIAREVGLELDPTYTAKAFAAALRLVECEAMRPFLVSEPISGFIDSRGSSGRPLRVLYWHTLSSVSLETLERNAFLGPLPDRLQALLPRG
jgi:1-aminocyclopropane-1-carboxylate deaminase/D-cysteine desulfhydrase-like pyridoxal-dependent ACC family enzyme